METKTQRNLRLKNMRRKYGLGEFKSQRRTRTKFKREVNMARRKRVSRRASNGGTSNLMGTALGVGGYILFESYLEPKITSVIGNDLLLNAGELAVGLWLSRKGGVVGNIGKAAVVINAYQIIKPLLANITPSSTY